MAKERKEHEPVAETFTKPIPGTEGIARLVEPETLAAKPSIEAAIAVLKESGLVELLREIIHGGKNTDQYLKFEEQCIAQQARIRAETEKTAQQRTQEAADKLWPGRPEQQRWRVHLPDKNLQPEIVVPAETEADAIGRYNQVCGINSSQTKHTVALVG